MHARISVLDGKEHFSVCVCVCVCVGGGGGFGGGGGGGGMGGGGGGCGGGGCGWGGGGGGGGGGGVFAQDVVVEEMPRRWWGKMGSCVGLWKCQKERRRKSRGRV